MLLVLARLTLRVLLLQLFNLLRRRMLLVLARLTLRVLLLLLVFLARVHAVLDELERLLVAEELVEVPVSHRLSTDQPRAVNRRVPQVETSLHDELLLGVRHQVSRLLRAGVLLDLEDLVGEVKYRVSELHDRVLVLRPVALGLLSGLSESDYLLAMKFSALVPDQLDLVQVPAE